MGLLFSCPVDEEDAPAEAGLPAPPGGGNAGETAVLKAPLDSGKLRFDESLSFKLEQQSPIARLQVETKISVASPRATVAPVPMPRELARTRFADAATAAAAPESPKHESAAVTVQKVYKSFRTRRRLADCAVLVEQSWWELLDFALLRRSSVSFFDIERQESAVSKWARARTRAAKKKKGTFQHSSFLAGGATSAAGRLVVEDGVLKAIWPHSGHYRPTEENFQEFQSFLKDKSVDLTDVKMSPDEDDEEFWSRLKSIPSDCCAAAADKPEEDETVAAKDTNPCTVPLVTEATTPEEVSFSEHEEILTNPKPISTITRQDSSEEAVENAETSTASDSASSEYPHEESRHDDDNTAVPREKILQRISSKKETKSYQLGKQVSFKWTTGAGPRIVCVRDYPSELQLRVLEQMHLSPRLGGAGAGRAASSRFASPQRSGSPTARGRCEQLALGSGGGRAASSRFASPQRSSSPMARGRCEPLTPREAFRTHLMARG